MLLYIYNRDCLVHTQGRKDMKRYLIAVIMTAGLLTGACGDSETAADNGGSEEPASSDELTWFHNDFDAASAEAEATGKPLLIDMYADLCPPCRTLSEEYFTSDEMYPVLSSFVLLKIDVDDPDMARYSQRYDVSSIPCVVIAEADGTEIDRIVGTTPTIAGYVTALEGILRQI